MDESDRQKGPRLNKVIRSDSGGAEGARLEKPLLRPPPRAGVVNAEDFEAHTSAKQIIAERYVVPEAREQDAHRPGRVLVVLDD